MDNTKKVLGCTWAVIRDELKKKFRWRRDWRVYQAGESYTSEYDKGRHSCSKWFFVPVELFWNVVRDTDKQTASKNIDVQRGCLQWLKEKQN